MSLCPHPETWAEDGTPSARLWCGACGEVLIQPPGWEPTRPRRVCWVRRTITNAEMAKTSGVTDPEPRKMPR